MDTTALWLTLKLAAFTSIILLCVLLPLACWLVEQRGLKRYILESLLTMPLVLPPTVLGFYLLWFTSSQSFLGRHYELVIGHSLPFSFTGILIGSLIFNIPFAMKPFLSALESVDRKYIEASWCLGAGKMKTFFRVVFPLCWQGIMVGIILPFAHCLGEFGVVLMLGGNIPGVTRTVSLVIYDQVQSLDYHAAHQASLLLIGISFSLVFILQILTVRQGVGK